MKIFFEYKQVDCKIDEDFINWNKAEILRFIMSFTLQQGLDFLNKYFAQQEGETFEEHFARAPRLSSVMHAMNGKGPKTEDDWCCHLCQQHIDPQEEFTMLHAASGEVVNDVVYCVPCVGELMEETGCGSFVYDPVDPSVEVRAKPESRQVWATLLGFLPR